MLKMPKSLIWLHFIVETSINKLLEAFGKFDKAVSNFIQRLFSCLEYLSLIYRRFKLIHQEKSKVCCWNGCNGFLRNVFFARRNHSTVCRPFRCIDDHNGFYRNISFARRNPSTICKSLIAWMLIVSSRGCIRNQYTVTDSYLLRPLRTLLQWHFLPEGHQRDCWNP